MLQIFDICGLDDLHWVSGRLKRNRNLARVLDKAYDKTYNAYNTAREELPPGMTLFCEDHNLTTANMHKVIQGKRRHHKNWTIK